MTELKLQNLVKRFGDVIAVDDVSMTVPSGGFVALLGYSGCGKTTSLRMIAGLEEPTEGDILFDNETVLHLAPNHRNIGMIFQRYVLFPHMNVEKNVGFGLRMKGVDRNEIRKRVKEVLDVVQLAGYEKRFPSQLSGGQQQRIAIARTVITNPKLLLMDEPLSNLDAKLREEMRSFITDLQKRLNITTMFVTHDQIEAIELADHIGVMFDGKIVQYGPPEDIFNRPATPEIADFMGATNLIKGNLIEKDNATRCAISVQNQRFDVMVDSPHEVGTPVISTIRPEHIELHPAVKDGAPTQNILNAKIKSAVYHGGTLSYYLQAGDIELQARDQSTRRFSEGEEVVAHLNPEHLWIFPEAGNGA